MDSKIEVSKEVLEEIFKIANLDVPKNITNEAMLQALGKLKNPVYTDGEGDFSSFTPTSNNILVIDDIGIVTYQLKILLSNIGYNVLVAKDIFSGLNTFVKTNFDFVIMDLFVSTEQEGYTLLNETKKIITKNNLNTKIIVITASNKAESKVKCINGGADIFLKKEADWQNKLLELIETAKENTKEEI